MVESKGNIGILEAYRRGYRIEEGILKGPKGNMLKLQIGTSGYYNFNIKINKKTYHVPIHRFVAYQKYGSLLFNTGMVVRHLDGVPKNNSESNIVLGTASDNMMDIPKNIRLEKSRRAASFKIKHSVKAVQKLRQEGMTYEQIMENTGITSKGTISYILNKRKIL